MHRSPEVVHPVRRSLHLPIAIGLFHRNVAIAAAALGGILAFWSIPLGLAVCLALLAFAFYARRDDRLPVMVVQRYRYRLTNRYDPWKHEPWIGVVIDDGRR